MSKIIHYTPEHYNALLEYFLKTNPQYSKEYFDYTINVIPQSSEEMSENIIVLNNDDQIVGCHLYFPSKALIQGVEHKIFWGHDTYLDEEYRRELGFDFMLAQKPNGYSFGAGLSLINYKIQKRIKVPFLGTFHDFIKINWKTPFAIIIFRLFNFKCNDLKSKDVIKVNGISFERITNISQMVIPNNGYWFNDNSDVEFIRDEHFIEKRLLNNFNQYHLYAHKGTDGTTDIYFAVRVIHRKGTPVLSVVDFRYSKGNHNALSIIMKAANIIACSNNIPFTQLTTTIELDKNIYTFRMKENPCAAVIGPKSIKYNNIDPIIVTKADADEDFQDA